MDISAVVNFILNPTQSIYFWIVQILFIAAGLFFLGFTIFGLLRTSWADHYALRDVREITTFKPYAVRKIDKQWLKIMARLETDSESEYKLAVLETETILDDILARMGYAGTTLGERLKLLTPEIIPNLKELAEVHQIRNSIVHDPDYQLFLNEAKRVIAIYENALTVLQAF